MIFFLSSTAAVANIPTFTVTRKQLNTTISLSLNNSVDWEGHRGKRIRDRDIPVTADSPESMHCRIIQASVDLLQL